MRGFFVQHAICLSVFVSAVLRLCQPATAVDFVRIPQDPMGGGYQAFPDVTRLLDGRLMCAFYNGYQHVSIPNGTSPTGGRIDYSISSDAGFSWSTPAVLYDGDLDERDPSITQLPSGQLLCSFFDMSRGVSQVRSLDGGASWSSPNLVAANPYYVSSPARLLSNGRLIMGVYKENSSVANGAVIISDNQGASWSSPIDIPLPPAGHPQRLDAETDVIQLKDGKGDLTSKLYAVQRTACDSAYFATSSDFGITWTESQAIGFNAHCPYLHRTARNIVLLGYRNYVGGRTSLRYSLDECQTWSSEVIVDEVYGGAYPSIVDLRDGTQLITYYEEGSGSNIRAKRFSVSETGVEWLPVVPMYASEPDAVSLVVTGGILLGVCVWRQQRKVQTTLSRLSGRGSTCHR